MEAFQNGKPWLLRAGLFIGLISIVVWEVTSRTFAAYLAIAAPEQALVLRPHQSAALLSLADQKLGEIAGDAKSSGDLAVVGQLRVLTQAALSDAPLNARALRILGQLSDLAHDDTQAWKFMAASAHYSMNESPAVAWLADKSFEKEDYESALHYADVLLRTRPQLISYAMPMLGRLAEEKDAVSELKELLSKNPPWRPAFFEAIPRNVSDARTPLELLSAVKQSPSPPTNDDLRGYLNFLIARKLYALAYYAWLQFLPEDQLGSIGLLFNASFETEPSGLPFDWVIPPGTGVSVALAPAPDLEDGRALSIAFDQGRVEFPGITQLVVLPPGKYRFSARHLGEVIGQRGLKWRVSCAGGANIGESAMIAGRLTAWKSFEFGFEVPGTECPAQYLRLDLDARMSSEQFVSGTVWADDAQLIRLPDLAKN
jgi:tetratricopeptide (TPR) repeat protein